jgi:hypothetical protein
MITRAKVNRRFWGRLEKLLKIGWPRMVRVVVSRELSRTRIESYRRGFNEGAEYMQNKLSGKYNAW